MAWLVFITVAAIIFVAGTNLARYGDIIAEKTGLERSWIGLILLATVTSLPEVVTGISSVTINNLPNITAGDIFGSCMFNLLIIALLDIFHKRVPVTGKAHEGHVLSAALGIFLLGFAAMGLILGDRAPVIGWVGLPSLIFLGAYFLAMRLVFNHDKRRVAQFLEATDSEKIYGKVSANRAYGIFGLNALVVIVAASFLPGAAEGIAEASGLSNAFVGTLFVALSTSLPEVVVSMAALKIGAVDMAFGNVLGSNLFNIAVLGMADIFYIRGPLLPALDGSHMASIVAAIIMTGFVIIGLSYRAESKRMPLSWDSVGILLVYALTVVLLAT